MVTKHYAALAVGASFRLQSKEVVPIRGRSRIHFDRHPLAILVSAIVVVGLLVAIVVGLGGVFHFLFSFLLPMAVVLLVVVGTVVLAVQGGAKVLDERDRPSSTNVRRSNVRHSPRGEGFSDPVYWMLMSLFLVASVAMACFFWLVIRDQWLYDRLLVAGRFDGGETLRVLFVLLATVGVSSGLLWRHYRRIAAYGSPLEPFFMLVFTLCGGLAAVAALPALFAG
jgi:magnesium-transporting ATPase (P-type)